MSKNFRIILSSTLAVNERPQISRKVADYFEEFVVENILKEKRIIIGSKWQYELVLTFVDESEHYKSDYIYMPATHTTVTAESIKIYDLLIPTKLLMSKQDKYHALIELLYEAVCLFFSTTFKKANQDFLKAISSRIDFSYLHTIPFPANVLDQQFLGDEILNGQVKNIVDRFYNRINGRGL